MVKSRSKAYDSPENQLSLTLGSITVYIPISTSDVLPHINVQSSTLLLPLYLSSFIILQDLILEYAHQVVQVILQFKSHKQEAPTHTAHNRSNSSLSFVMGGSSSIMGLSTQRTSDRSRANQRQTFLQKGASRVKKMASTVKNVGVGTATLKKKVTIEPEKKRNWRVTLNIEELMLHVQVSKVLFLTYSLHNLITYCSDSTLLLSLLQHGIEFVRTDAPYSDRFFTCQSLPEVIVAIDKPSAATTQRLPRREHVPSVSTASGSVVRTAAVAIEGDDTVQGKKSVAGSAFNSNSGQSIEKETDLHVEVLVETLKIILTTKQVNQFSTLIVSELTFIHI